MNAQEKVAYLKGLMDGMKLDKEDDSTKLFAAIADVLDVLAQDVDDLDTGLCELNDEVDEIDEDLGQVEELVYGEDDEDDDCCCDDEEEDCCYSAKCPNCGETVEFDECDIEDGVIFCPNCNEKLEFTFDDSDDDCCCEEDDCCCNHKED